MITPKKTVVRINTYHLEGKVEATLRSLLPLKKASLTLDGATHAFENGACSFEIEHPHLWTLDDPYLYDALVSLSYENGEEEEVPVKLAFRTLGQNGRYVTLNGSPIYIRGYIRGAKAHEHQNDLHLPESEFYAKNIKTAKAFGFNFCRFHSYVPDEAYFEVADRLGLLVHVEFRMPSDSYNNLFEMVHATGSLVPDEFVLRLIDLYYEHPSLAVYCIGNELKGEGAAERILEIGRLVKKEDPSRLFLDTCAWGKLNRPNVDLDVQHLSYFFPYGKHASMYSDPHTIHTLQGVKIVDGVSPYKVPLLAHEVCHYTALRDYASLKEKFEKAGTPAPWWIDEELGLTHEKGFDEDFPEMFKASKHFQWICWKTAFEAMRKSPLLGGFHFLQLADTDAYENSNGMLDCFDDPTYTKPEDVLPFNGDRVLLIDLPKHNFSHEETLSTPIYLSNFGKEVHSISLSYRILRKGEVLLEGTLPIENEKPGFGCSVISHLSLPLLDLPGEITLSLKATINKQEEVHNEWTFYVYTPKRIFSYQEFTHYEDGKVLVTDDVGKALSSLKEGRRVVLIYRSSWTRHLLDKQQPHPEYAFRATWNRFKPVIWDRGTNYGGILNQSLLEKHGFPASKYYDFDFACLSEDSDKIILDDFPVRPTSLISGTDKSTRDRFDAYKDSFNLPELMGDRCWRIFSYLFELKVGNSSLLVTGMNLTHLDEKEPSSEAYANFLLDYASSEDFHPAVSLRLEKFEEYLKKSALTPVKERMMTQYWELDDAPVESAQYWKDSREYLQEKN